MVFVTGRVVVSMKDGTEIKGEVMPYEDVEYLQEHFPVYAKQGVLKKKGVFVFTGRSVVFLDAKDICSMSCLRFA